MVRSTSGRGPMGQDEAPAPAPASALDFRPSQWQPSPITFRAYNAMQSEIQQPNRPLRSLRIVVSPPIVAKLTKHLVGTYNKCNPAFTYSEEFNPKRYLTNPSAGVSNNGLDNKNSDLIIAVSAVLVNSISNRKYVVKEMLGQGTFGQVVKCWSVHHSSFVAVKVIKNQDAYYRQAIVEIEILRMLNSDFDPDDRHHIVRILDFFIHQEHLCIAFELLSHNLYELLRVNKYRGISLQLLRSFTKQILDSLAVLRDAGVIHCDLKPENILLSTSLRTGEIKLIDFGSACKETRTVYSYIQSRFYRSPEVVLGHPYSTAIDMWSLGCVAAELFLGLPLFAGDSEYDLLRRMIDTLGCQPPVWLLRGAKNTSKYFKHASAAPLDDDAGAYQFLTASEYKARENKEPQVGKTYLKHTKLEDIISKYPYKSTLTAQEKEAEQQRRLVFLDFLRGLVRFDPITRWTPRQASQHPFITEEAFTGRFEPIPETPRTAIAYGMAVDHNPGARGHWFAAGLSPQVSYANAGHHQHHYGSPQYPFSFASSYGSCGSGVGSYDGYGGGGAATTGGSYDWSSMYHPTPPGGPPVEWRRMYPSIPTGYGPLGISPSSSVFQPVSLGGSPSQFTPPGSQFPSPQSSPGRFGPPSPRYGKGALKQQQQRRGFVPPPSTGIPLSFDSGRQQNGSGFDSHLEAGTSGSHSRGSHLRPYRGGGRGSYANSPGYRAGSLEAYLSASEPGSSSEFIEYPASHPDSGDWFPNDSNDLLEEDRLASGSGGARLGPGQGFEAHRSMRRLNHHLCESSSGSSSARVSLYGSYDEGGGGLLQSYGGGGGSNHNHSQTTPPFSSPQHPASLLSRQLNSQHQHHLYHQQHQQQQQQQLHHHQRAQRAPPPPIYHPDYPQAFIGFPAGYQCPPSAHEQHVAGVAR